MHTNLMSERTTDGELSSPYSHVVEEDCPTDLNVHLHHLSDNDNFMYRSQEQDHHSSSYNIQNMSSRTYQDMIITLQKKMKQIYQKETLLVEVVIVILLAKIYPRIGVEFVFPEITAHWIAVMTIFCKCHVPMYSLYSLCISPFLFEKKKSHS